MGGARQNETLSDVDRERRRTFALLRDGQLILWLPLPFSIAFQGLILCPNFDFGIFHLFQISIPGVAFALLDDPIGDVFRSLSIDPHIDVI